MMRPLAWYQLREEIEDFLYFEADLLDQRRFKEWLDLLAEDLVYFMPVRRNVKFGQQAERENTRQGEGISWFDEDKWTLGKRVEQVLTGVHYAEEPLSRVAHLVTNVRLLGMCARRWMMRGRLLSGAGSWYIRIGWNTRTTPSSAAAQTNSVASERHGRSPDAR
jgi:hypothetical protein